MSKEEFKIQYSEYRKFVNKHRRTLTDFREALNANSLYRECFLKTTYPVSVRVANYLAKK